MCSLKGSQMFTGSLKFNKDLGECTCSLSLLFFSKMFHWGLCHIPFNHCCKNGQAFYFIVLKSLIAALKNKGH